PRMTRLRRLAFDGCRRLEHLDAVLAGLRLESLQLTRCGSLRTVGFAASMPELASLVFVGTELVDGDLAALTAHPALRHVAFTRKPHFSHGERDVMARLRARGAAA
ncbi:MAG TPA: hypothetical protein VIG68_08015, partial [Lysobacter sp.]